MVSDQTAKPLKPIALSSLNAGSIAVTDYFGEKGDLLISKGTVITQRHLDMLANRNNFDLFISPSEGDNELNGIDAGGSERPGHAVAIPDGHGRARSIDVFALPSGHEGLLQLLTSSLAEELEAKLRKKKYVDQPAGRPLKKQVSHIPVSKRTGTYKEKISRFYAFALDQTEKTLSLLAGDHDADATDLERIVKRFVALFVSDHNILLNISGRKSSKNDSIFQHSLNVCLLAINVAAAYGYNEKQVLEIGMGALVHDIGMLLIPSSIRLKKARLSQQEWCEIQKHPIIGLHLLRKLRNMPERIPYIAYQVHERENATGYPRQHGGSDIHRFAKMVEVADIFEALTSPRPHRPAYLPNQGVYKLIQMSRKELLPDDAVKAFLEYTSLFPVGSIVELSNCCIGKVVHSNRSSLHQPIVSVLIDERGNRIDAKKMRLVDLVRRNDLQIVKTLPFDSFETIDIMDGF